VKKRTVILLIMLIFTIAFMVILTKDNSKKNIDNYNGDGEITYIEGPMLGIPGYKIQMESFDISKPYAKNYSLSGLPTDFKSLGITRNNRYIIYLVIEEPAPIENIKKGYLELILFKDKQIEKKLIAKSIGEMVNTYGGGYNRFYFEEQVDYKIIPQEGDDWFIEINISNNTLDFSKEAYILVSAGGYA